MRQHVWKTVGTFVLLVLFAAVAACDESDGAHSQDATGSSESETFDADVSDGSPDAGNDTNSASETPFQDCLLEQKPTLVPAACEFKVGEWDEGLFRSFVGSCDPGEVIMEIDRVSGSHLSFYRSGDEDCETLVRILFGELGGASEVWTCEFMKLENILVPESTGVSRLREFQLYIEEQCAADPARQGEGRNSGLLDGETCRSSWLFHCPGGFYCDSEMSSNTCTSDVEFVCQPYDDLCDSPVEVGPVSTCGSQYYESPCEARNDGAIGPLFPEE